jgi:hypothetical protein
MLVIGAKRPEWNCAQFIVCQAKNKPSDKIGLIKVKDAPIKSQVLTSKRTFLVHIMPSDGRVAIKTVDFLMRRTSQEAHFYGIKIFWTQFLLCLCRNSIKVAK